MTASLGDLLFVPSSVVAPDEIAVIDDDGETTWQALTDAAEQIAARLAAASVDAGSPIAVQMDDSAALIAVLFGVWRAGCVYVPINPKLTPVERDRLLERTDAAAIVTTAGRSPAIEPRDGRGTKHPSDIALVQMTSGTTGEPKPVLLRHTGVLELMDGVLQKIRSTPPSSRSSTRAMPNLIPVSLSLWAGIYNVLFAFRVGASAVVMNGFTTEKFACLVREHQIRSTVLPPAALTMLADDPDLTTLAPLRFVRSITAPLSPLQARRFHDKFGIAVLNGYGQTEIGGEIIGWNAQDSREFGESKLGAVGRPHAGIGVRTDATTGEIQVHTPALSAGYADGNDLSDRLTADGWFRTGDVGRVDHDGFVWIDGRVTDMINRGGLKVHPAEVEEVLRLHASVADAAVVGVADERLGEVPVAFLVARDGAPLDDPALDAHCRDHLAPYKIPVRFEPIDALPRNDVGKVLTRQLVDRMRPR